MELGDFTKLAKEYVNRTGYSENVLSVIYHHICSCLKAVDTVADVGAGTGKLTENLIHLGLHGFAVEPNDAMRTEGIRLLGDNPAFLWSKGTAEMTGLDDHSVDWILMGSSFHWADAASALKEFYRVLRPGGFFTAIWNPRNLESSEFHKNIEIEIQKAVPQLNRISSGSRANMKDMDKKLLSTPYFEDLFLVEGNHCAEMSKERYMGAWRSVNDIHAQAGDDCFEQILQMIEHKIMNMEKIIVPYTSRAFTVRSTRR